MLGAIEAGGTKVICGVGTGPDDLKTISVPTTTPDDTLRDVLDFFRANPVSQIGIGSFGPVDLNLDSPTWGQITSTPKRGWAHFDLCGSINKALGVPVAFDTDVNAAIRGEARWGAARGLTDAVYITVGTGVGGGAMSRGQVLHGLVHPEMGHLRLPHDLLRDPFPGNCPYHGDCLEGLASGPALRARWGVPATELGPTHQAWSIEAQYLALAAANLTFTLSPQRIIFGGGVMQNLFLFPLVRREFQQLLNGYIQHPRVLSRIDEFLVPPQLGNAAGILGALVLAEEARA